jgi:hypothetical protein
MLDRNIGSDTGSERQVAAEIATSYSKMSVGVLLIFAIGLVIAGVLVRRWVIITLGRRSRRDLTQRAPPRRDAVSGRVAYVVSDDETRRALQKLLQVLEQQAVRGWQDPAMCSQIVNQRQRLDTDITNVLTDNQRSQVARRSALIRLAATFRSTSLNARAAGVWGPESSSESR